MLDRFKLFQIRWREALGLPNSPYVYRWMLIFFGFSIRLHHWIKSDDRRYFHDHACNFISIVLKGYYWNVVPGKIINYTLCPCNDPDSLSHYWVQVTPFRPRYMKATQKHYFDVPASGAWTLLLCGRPYHKWGFYVNGHKWRPLHYFHKFGVIQDEKYQ